VGGREGGREWEGGALTMTERRGLVSETLKEVYLGKT
jgi:hypothetical protein